MTLKKLFLFSFSILFIFSISYSKAQDFVFTKEDTLDCEQKILQYKELEKQDKKDEAVVIWKETYQNYKKLNSRVIIHGINYIRDKLKNGKGSGKKELVDSIMNLYIQYIEFHGRKGFVLGRQGIDLLKYNKSRFEEGYNLLDESIKLQNFDSEPAVVLSYMQSAIKMRTEEKISKSELDTIYHVCDRILCAQMKDSARNQEIIKQAFAGIERLYFGSMHHGYCEHLISILTKRYNEYQDNYKELEKIARILSRFECTDSQLFYEVAVKMDSLDRRIKRIPWPKPWEKVDNYYKYIDKLQSFVKLENNDTIKSRLYYKIAQLYNHEKEKAIAKCYVDSSMQCNSKYGAPYILLATMYANAFSEDSTAIELKKKSGYWTAVDKLLIVKKLDPEIKDAANKLIERYSKNFPTKVELEKYGLKPGDKYHIGGWINETTTVRVKE